MYDRCLFKLDTCLNKKIQMYDTESTTLVHKILSNWSNAMASALIAAYISHSNNTLKTIDVVINQSSIGLAADLEN